MISRRRFLKHSTALVAGAELPFFADGAMHSKENRLRLGVIADPHIKSVESVGTLERVLRYFDSQKVDGVICAGDLATSGISSELERVSATWFKVFPGNRRSDGGAVAQLFIFGDHDMGGYAWKESLGVLPEKELRAQTIPTYGPEKIWERCFHEKWEPVQVKTVKGYTFVLAHHPRHEKETAFGNYIPDAAPTLAAHAKELRNGKPFFYIQHRPIPCLADAESVWGNGDPRIAETLRMYPSCVAVTGHMHRNCTDERMIWQGGFTALNVPSLRYLCLRRGRENSSDFARENGGEKMMKCLMPRDGQQGYLMDIEKGEITVHRLDFSYSTGEPVAGPWKIPLPVPGVAPYAYEERTRKEISPAFPLKATVRVRARKDRNRAGKNIPSVVVAFPPAFSTQVTPRAFEYEITAESASARVVKRVFSGKCYLPEALDAGNVECVFSRAELGEGTVTFTIYPCGSFGIKGKPIMGRLA